MTPRNYRICTLDRHLDCSSCTIRGKLECTPGAARNTRVFYGSLSAMVASAFAGLAMTAAYTGRWWTVPFYLVFWVVYQLYNELLIHCTHCPMWNEGSGSIKCMVNCGIPKPGWKWMARHLRYNPLPYSFRERITINLFNSFSILFPWAVIAYGNYAAWGTGRGAFLMAAGIHLLYLASMLVFFSILTGRFCRRCVNFSCPMNMVSPEVVCAYLERNPYIADAWKRSGYCDKGKT
jgi:hypothetical protein